MPTSSTLYQQHCGIQLKVRFSEIESTLAPKLDKIRHDKDRGKSVFHSL